MSVLPQVSWICQCSLLISETASLNKSQEIFFYIHSKEMILKDSLNKTGQSATGELVGTFLGSRHLILL